MITRPPSIAGADKDRKRTESEGDRAASIYYKECNKVVASNVLM